MTKIVLLKFKNGTEITYQGCEVMEGSHRDWITVEDSEGILHSFPLKSMSSIHQGYLKEETKETDNG